MIRTQAERLLVERFCGGWDRIERRSEREFDLDIDGEHPPGHNLAGCRFSAWLPLAVIYDHPRGWDDEVFAMSDYSMAGDWSAIRDSSHETIWRIFGYLVESSSEERS